MVPVEVEHVEEIANGWHVPWNLGVRILHYWIGQVVTAAAGQRLQIPVALDELQDRDVIRVSVVDVAAFGEGRNYYQRDARSIAEEINGLHEAGVKISAALVKGDEDGSFLPQLWAGLDTIHNFLHESFKQV